MDMKDYKMGLLKKLPNIFTKNPDSLFAHVVDAIDVNLGKASADLRALFLQYNIRTASGEWLDIWGSWFGSTRLPNEDDESFRVRIITSTVKPKNTIPAIEDAIRVFYNEHDLPVDVYEPHTDIFKWNISPLSGTHHLFSKEYYSHAIIDIKIPRDFPPALQKIIQDVKSAGILVYYTRILNMVTEDGTVLEMLPDQLDMWTNVHRVTNMYVDWDAETAFSRYSIDAILSGGRILWTDLIKVSNLISENYEDSKIEGGEVVVDNSPLKLLRLSTVGTYDGAEGAFSGYRTSSWDDEHPIDHSDTTQRVKAESYAEFSLYEETYGQAQSIQDMQTATRFGYSSYDIPVLSGEKRVGSCTENITDILISDTGTNILAGSLIVIAEIMEHSIEMLNEMENHLQMSTEVIVSDV